MALKKNSQSEIHPPQLDTLSLDRRMPALSGHSSEDSHAPRSVVSAAAAKPSSLFKSGKNIFVLELEEVGSEVHKESLKASSVSPKSQSMLRQELKPTHWKPTITRPDRSHHVRIGDLSPKRRHSGKLRDNPVALRPRITAYHTPS